MEEGQTSTAQAEFVHTRRTRLTTVHIQKQRDWEMMICWSLKGEASPPNLEISPLHLQMTSRPYWHLRFSPVGTTSDIYLLDSERTKLLLLLPGLVVTCYSSNRKSTIMTTKWPCYTLLWPSCYTLLHLVMTTLLHLVMITLLHFVMTTLLLPGDHLVMTT